MTNDKEPTREVQAFGSITAERSAELASVAVATSAKAEVEAAYIMAMRNPRNEDDARAKIMRACTSPLFAQKARYRKPVGSKQVNGQWVKEYVIGPSIRFAEEMLRCWKNVLTQQTAIYDDQHKRIIRITTRDLEANTAYSKEIALEKTVERSSDKGREVLGNRLNSEGKIVHIVKATEDELTIKESALASKVIRNNGLRLIPQHIIDEAMAEVERMVKEKITKDPEAERRAILDGFSRRGVMPSDLERFIGCPSAQFTPDNLVTLRDMLTSIEDGHATWSEYIEGTVAQTTEEIKEKSQPETKGKAVAEKLKTVAEERQVKQPEPTSEQQPEQPQQEPEPKEQKADEPAQQPATEGDRKLIANAVKGAELKLRSTVEGTQKLNKILASMKVRLSGKQVPLDVIPVEQHEFYLDKLDKAVNELQK
jgi:outer membrane biosynthesis protein TonB